MKINEIRKNAVWIAEGILGYENCTYEETQKAWQQHAASTCANKMPHNTSLELHSIVGRGVDQVPALLL